MNSFWTLFSHALPIGLGIVLSLISIAYTMKVIGYHNEGDIILAIIFGVIGFPTVIASTIKFIKMFSEN